MKTQYLGALLRTTAVCLTLWIAATAPAAAACTGNGCDGKDPNAEGCAADAYTVDVKILPNQQKWVELRYSPRCGTNWARTGSSIPYSHDAFIERFPDLRRYRQLGFGFGVYTNMVYCPSPCRAWACDQFEGGGVPYCTGQF